MIFSPSFRKTIFISLLTHITVFSIFSFSFGDRIPALDYTNVSFFGAILRSADLAPPFLLHRDATQQERAGLVNRQNFKGPTIKEIFMKSPNVTPLDNAKREYYALSNYYLKPAATLGLSESKMISRRQMALGPFLPSRKEQVIMFYPLLPYHFLLYFKDRQVAHIELMFNITSTPNTNSIAVKRKISSGNLEADLLAMRYINHYLFIQQGSFAANNWQRVKIELSCKDDKY